jgi:hypothetical protein
MQKVFSLAIQELSDLLTESMEKLSRDVTRNRNIFNLHMAFAKGMHLHKWTVHER